MNEETMYDKQRYSLLQNGMIRFLIVGVFIIGSMIPVAGYAQSPCATDHNIAGKRILDSASGAVVLEMDTTCQTSDEAPVTVDVQQPQLNNVPRSGTTTLMSRDPENKQFSMGTLNPSISATGQYVLFNTFIPGTPEGQVYVRDQSTDTTKLISVSADGEPGNGLSDLARITPNGRYVVFSSFADNLVADDTNGANDIFLYDGRQESIQRVNVASDGTESNGFSTFFPSVSADGRYIVFNSDADNLVPDDTNESNDVFIRDRVFRTTQRVSTAQDGSAAGGVSVSISSSGRFIAYVSSSDDVVADDTNGAADAFVYDRITKRTELVSVASDGTQAELPSGVSPRTLVFDVEMSPDGRYVVFSSKADNLVENDTNDQTDVFLHDRTRNTTERVSITADGDEGNAASAYAAVSLGGRYIVFHSNASNLVANDANAQTDVFVRDRVEGTTTRMSVDSGGAESNGASGLITQRDDTFSFITAEPGIDWLGRTTVFESSATNLVTDDTNEHADIFGSTMQ
ncbi:MAG: hypothetical protein AAGF95_26305 [Chloroflexota bacterium]